MVGREAPASTLCTCAGVDRAKVGGQGVDEVSKLALGDGHAARSLGHVDEAHGFRLLTGSRRSLGSKRGSRRSCCINLNLDLRPVGVVDPDERRRIPRVDRVAWVALAQDEDVPEERPVVVRAPERSPRDCRNRDAHALRVTLGGVCLLAELGEDRGHRRGLASWASGAWGPSAQSRPVPSAMFRFLARSEHRAAEARWTYEPSRCPSTGKSIIVKQRMVLQS